MGVLTQISLFSGMCGTELGLKLVWPGLEPLGNGIVPGQIAAAVVEMLSRME